MGLMKIEGEKRIGVSNILSALYFLSGAMLLASMSLVGGLPIHLALVGVLNISTSYSLTRMRRLSFYIAVINSLVSLVFGCSSLIALILLLSQNTAEGLMLAGFIGYIAVSYTHLTLPTICSV